MSSIAAQLLIGQSPEVVQTYLGQPRHTQTNAGGQTDLYVYTADYLAGVFPVEATGIIGVFRNRQCIALKVVLPKNPAGQTSFVFSREIAQRLYGRVSGGATSTWSQIEGFPKGGNLGSNLMHYVYCVGPQTAITWDAEGGTQVLSSDVSVYLDARCGQAEPVPQPQSLGGATPAVVNLTQSTTQETSVPGPSGSGSSGPGSSGPGSSATEAPEPEVRPIQPIVFTDIEGHLYKDDILKAANVYKFIAGYDDGSFKPDASVSREQGIVMLVNALKGIIQDPKDILVPDEVTEPPFIDVPINHKSAPQFFFAKQAGILSGDDLNRCNPDAKLTRAELITVIHNGLQYAVEANYNATSAKLQEAIKPIVDPVTFTDLGNHWAAKIIQEMSSYGIATPLNEAGLKYAPDAAATRGYAAAALVRMEEVQLRNPLVGTKPGVVYSFPDIDDNLYHDQILKAANQYHIVAGYEDGTFRPEDPVSREQAVAILVNTMGQLAKDPSAITIPETLSDPPPFKDVQAGEMARKIQFAKEAGIISGDEQGNFSPLTPLSRTALMSMIHNALLYLIEQGTGQSLPITEVVTPIESPPSFTDIADDYWGAQLVADLAAVGIATPLHETGTEFGPELKAGRDFTAAAMVRMLEANYQPSAGTKPAVPLPTVNFNDIADNPYNAEILAAANRYKIVAGYEDGSFRPQASVSREQAVAIIVDALKYKVVDPDAVKIPDYLIQPPFADVDINRWSAPRLYFAKQAGLISGDDQGRFNPAAQLSRAQLMAILNQALSYSVWANFNHQALPLTEIMDTAGIEPHTFTDIPANHWAKAMIEEMNQVGLAAPASPEQPGRFQPDTTAQRDFTVAAAVHMIEAPYGREVESGGEVTFFDISASPYAAEILQAVNTYHIVSGNEDGTFRPAESISREQVVSMLVESLKQMVQDPALIAIPASVTKTQFEDVPPNSVFAPKIEFVVKAGIMNGDDTGLFRPKNDLTRAQLMVVASQALDYALKHGLTYTSGDVATRQPQFTQAIEAQFYDHLTAQLAGPQAGDQPRFVDTANHWAKDVIEAMASLGIADPYTPHGNQFMPDKPSRRDYAAASMVAMIEAIRPLVAQPAEPEAGAPTD